MVVLTGRGYSTAEVAAELGVHPSGRVPLDEGTAAALCGGRGPATVSRRKLSRSALGRFAGQYADYLADLHADRGGMPGAIPGPVLGGAQSDPSWSGAAATWPPEAAS